MKTKTANSPIKDKYFGFDFFERVSATFELVYGRFDRQRFLGQVKNNLNSLELKERIKFCSHLVHQQLPDDFIKALEILYSYAGETKSEFGTIFISDYVGRYGLDHSDLSMEALKDSTHLSTSELAVREFLLIDLESGLKEMKKWAEDENEHVRRLASEGSRPRLPWSFHLKDLQKDPSLAFPILEKLKADKSLYVRKSVANHLNDISKDNSEWLLQKLSGWSMKKRNTAWIVNRGLRTLVKKGDVKALELLDIKVSAKVQIKKFSVMPKNVVMGEDVEISVHLQKEDTPVQKLLINYSLEYPLKNGKRGHKIFRIKTLESAGKGNIVFSKGYSFKPLSTRTHYAGEYRFVLLINGAEKGARVVRLSGKTANQDHVSSDKKTRRNEDDTR